jgi:hypothetical protein
MPIDTRRVREQREKAKARIKTGGDLYKIQEGETKIFLHGTSRPKDTHPEVSGINWVEVCIHRNLGGKNNLQLCLDLANNPILTHPDVIEFALKKKNPVDLRHKMKCPTCARLAAGDIDGKLAAKNAPQVQWLFGFTPMFHRRPRSDEWTRLAFDPVIYVAGVTIFDDLTAEIVNLGTDPCDPNAATLFIIDRQGTGFQSTEYKARTDIETIRTPLKLDKGQRRIIEEATKPGGSCDLLRTLANFVKSPAQMEALMAGVEVAADDENAPPPMNQKECFGTEWEDVAECRDCPNTKECRDACSGGPEVRGEEPSEDEQNGDEPSEDEQNGDEPSEDEPEGDGDAAEPGGGDDELPSCWGTYEANDAGCAECDLAKKCDAERNKGKEPAKAPARRGKAGAPSAAKDAPASDPALDEIARQAEEVASRSRTRRRGE